MKIISISFFILFLISCSQESEIIKKNKIGVYELNHKLENKNVNREIFDITTNSDEIITSIIVRSNKYKTSEGFGVGTSFNELKKGSKEWNIQELKLNKGSVIIGNIGNSIIYDEIIFVDTNNDELTDFVWVTNNK